MTTTRRALRILTALAVSAIAGLGAMVVVAEVARSEPPPCRDTVTLERAVSASCATPEAHSALVIGAGVATSSLAFAGSLAGLQRSLKRRPSLRRSRLQ